MCWAKCTKTVHILKLLSASVTLVFGAEYDITCSQYMRRSKIRDIAQNYFSVC